MERWKKAMIYKYTLYRTDGTAHVFEDRNKKFPLEDLYKILDCRTIEFIPEDYYPDDDQVKNVTYYGDEEARFVNYPIRNPRMKILYDFKGSPWDVVGNLLREEKISERANSSK